MNEPPILEARGLTKVFGGVTALDSVDVTLEPGEMLGLIGPNGSGKSTLLSVLSGFYRLDGGLFRYDGETIARARPHELKRLGIARTFQNVRVFDDLSVLENILLGLHIEHIHGPLRSWSWIGDLLGIRGARRRETLSHEKATEFIETVGLSHVMHHRASQLSYGQRKRIEIARAIVSQPRLLLLDEPMAGIQLDGVEAILDDFIRPLMASGTAVILVEHRVELLERICPRIVVLASGRKIADGKPVDVLNCAEVRDAYLGD